MLSVFKDLAAKWQEIRFSFSEVDVTFLTLRIVSLSGGLFWLLTAPLAPIEKETLSNALALFSIYSLVCYGIIFCEPAWLRRVYLVSLFLDLIFLSYLVHLEPHLENSFFVGYYLLVCLHTIYFGLRFGIIVATLSTVFYFASIVHHINQYVWTELAVRMSFLFLIAVPVGLLSEKVKRDKKTVEDLNSELSWSLKILKEAQEKLIDAERYAALGRLTAYITHEIRNPLTAVGGFARRLEKKLSKGSPAKEYASIIVQEVARLEKILLDTLILGQTHDLQLVRGDINVPVKSAIMLYRNLCEEQKIIIKQKMHKETPSGWFDIEQVQLALDSLISNSIQVMPDGGTLSVGTDMKEQNRTTFLTITVGDTGGGMDPDTLEYIFEPFYSTKKIGLGTGLGLPIVKKIMDEHLGHVEIDNQPGTGTSVTLYFPYQSVEQDQMVPCWEYLKCGIETDPARQCGAYPHFGRICWSTAGSFSTQRSQGICAQKINDCSDCTFYQMVNEHLPMYVV